MDPILKQQLLAFILGGSFLSTITGFVTLKYTKKQAEAKALSSVQDVYQELIADLRADKEAMKKDKVESETRWTIRIEKLESNQQSQDKKIADNEKEIADLKRFKCINLSCNNRKSMKHYAHILICTASLACACSFCGCRATYQNDSSTQEQTRLSISDSALRIRTEDACSRFKLNQEEAGKGWKVKVNFDTSKPADPETGLSPISNIEIEGNEKTVKTLLQEDDTIHVSESQETKNDLTLQQSKQSASHKDAGSSVAAGIDNGIQYGLIIGIPIILIILTLIIHARFKQKDPSK